jgi:hypothetical protein
MKINDLDITKWWHWLVVVLVLAALTFLAFILAPAIMCCSCILTNNTTTSDHVTIEWELPNQQNLPTQTYPVNTDNFTINPPPPPPILPSDNCSWGY